MHVRVCRFLSFFSLYIIGTLIGWTQKGSPSHAFILAVWRYIGMGNGELCVMMDSDKWRLMCLPGAGIQVCPVLWQCRQNWVCISLKCLHTFIQFLKPPLFFLYLYNVHQKLYTTVACDESVLHTLHLASINDILTKYLTVLKLTHPHPHTHTHTHTHTACLKPPLMAQYGCHS